ncbi:MAG: glycosyltransferase [Spirochaetota bacterium]|jgi:cellulose synthase/poly-beta-1,6-N-acetylglucosamine synthase-like glycosyltransferase
MIALFTSLFLIIFVGLHVFLMIGLLVEYRRNQISATNEALIPVSIIIPVHNEAGRIKPLLESLLTMDYPFVQLIFVDDRSTDETVQLIYNFKKQFEFGNRTCQIIQLTENPGPNYKQFALTHGFKAATGEIVLLTDADCELPRSWIYGMVKRMTGSNTGVLIGPVFKKIPQNTLLYKSQAFDHAIRYMYLAASIGLGAAGGGFGNNMAVRKSPLDEIGGYGAVPISVTEDASLISFIQNRTSYKIRAGLGSDIQIMTETEQGWPSFIIQAVRWTKGGIFSPDLKTRLSFTFLMGMISLGILAIPLALLQPQFLPLPLAVFSAMLMNTLAVLSIAGNALQSLTPIDLIIQLFLTPVFNTQFTLLTIFRIPVYWKGKKV